MRLLRENSFSRRLPAVIAAAGAAVVGCALPAGLDAETVTPGDAGASEPGETQPPGEGDAAAGDSGETVDAAADAGADAGARDSSRPSDAYILPDAPLEASEDTGLDAAPDQSTSTGPEGGQDADRDAGSDAWVDAGGGVEIDAAMDAEIDAGTDAGCSDGPQVTFVTPTFGATIHVRTGTSSTYVYAFSLHVDFPCAPMQMLQFDYVGPAGIVVEQESIFTSYADPFTEQTQVGGTSSSLASHAGGLSTSSWLFSVTAVDAENRSTTVSEPFGLVVSAGGGG
jgi:hypothetical protein